MSRYWMLLLVLLTACGKAPPVPTTDTITYNIDSSRISVSGVSSGAYMAGQVHMAHSSIFNGVAIIAGGPYYCARGELSQGLGPCMKGGDMGLDSLLDYARSASAAGTIDDLANLDDDHAWIFHGALDTVMNQETSVVTAAFYAELMPDQVVTLVTDVAVVHGLPAVDAELACDTFGAPYLHACDYDAAFEILQSLHGELTERSVASGTMLTVIQPGFDDAEMLENAYLYVPTSCAEGAACGVHVALHGCSQSSEFVDDALAVGAGFNEWADSNQLLVLYPQVASSKIAPMNPYGCWDWWGYTSEAYATKNGPQVAAIKATLDALAGTTL